MFCPTDNINTDGIYPGKYTYREDLTPEMMAEVVMENYDPTFQNIAHKGDILLSGFNFGTGSSRAQAATALNAFGIQLVIAGSFSQTYKRNAINNGFILLECPALIDHLQKKYGQNFLLKVMDPSLIVSMKNSLIIFEDRQYPFLPLGMVAQELIIVNGLENWVRSEINKKS